MNIFGIINCVLRINLQIKGRKMQGIKGIKIILLIVGP